MARGKRATGPGVAGRGKTTARGIWRGALSIVLRYPLATILPALVLGSLAEALVLIGESEIVDEVLSNLAVVFVYYLYLAYVEQLVEGVRSGEGVPSFRRLHELLPIASVTLRMVAASSMVVGLVIAAIVAAALVAVGAERVGVGDPAILVAFLAIAVLAFVLLTRLSLFAPILSSERLGPLASLVRSARITRGHFGLVFWTAMLAFVLEGLVDEPLDLIGESLGAYGEWIAGSVLSALVMPVAAVATSLAYYRILLLEEQPTGETDEP